MTMVRDALYAACEEFGLQHGLSPAEVASAQQQGLVEYADTLNGTLVLWAQGLSDEEGRAAWRTWNRLQRRMWTPLKTGGILAQGVGL